jgi:hypothetical protein
MVVNFRACEINWGTYKLTRISILIQKNKKEKKQKNNFSQLNFKCPLIFASKKGHQPIIFNYDNDGIIHYFPCIIICYNVINFAHHTCTSATFPSSRKQLAVHNNMISTTGFCCLLSIFVLGSETLVAPHEHQIKYKNGVMNINNYVFFQRSRQRSIFWNTSRHALHTSTRVIYLPIFSDLITVMYRYEEGVFELVFFKFQVVLA